MAISPEQDAEEIVAVDLGGTHARFALARIHMGRVVWMGEPLTLEVSAYASLQMAWFAFAAALGRAPPRKIVIAVACPVGGDVLKLTNNPWVIRPASLAQDINADQLTLVNDFEAVAHAVAQAEARDLIHIAGPKRALPVEGLVSIVGPGTGLGVAQLHRAGSTYTVIPCEGGHMDFAPLDDFEDGMLRRLRGAHQRVSVERIVSGPGLANIYTALPTVGSGPVAETDLKDLWTMAIKGDDDLASAALGHFCLCLGAVAGDIVLAQGARALVLAGGISPRIAHLLPQSGFAKRFTAKGRFATMMADIPIWLIAHAQPGLYGAAAAFAVQHSSPGAQSEHDSRAGFLF